MVCDLLAGGDLRYHLQQQVKQIYQFLVYIRVRVCYSIYVCWVIYLLYLYPSAYALFNVQVHEDVWNIL